MASIAGEAYMSVGAVRQGATGIVVVVFLFTGLDYWTGLLDSKFTHKSRFLHSYNHQKLLSVLS